MLDRKYRPSDAEPHWQDAWEGGGVFRFDPCAPGRLFSIDTPPPTVSGSLHIGHVFSYTQAEIVARHRRMLGYNVFYPFGFDDNGLPTERLVEKERGVRAADMDRDEFVHLCRETVDHYHQQFKSLWRSLGFSVDWDLCYSTVSPAVQRLSQAMFLDLHDKGLAYRARRPTLWCPECGTSIAQADLEGRQEEVATHHVTFTVPGERLVVATTRPELLASCVAVVVHPEDARYTGLVGTSARVPLYDLDVPVISDAMVDQDEGTGVVMISTFGDAQDADWWQRYDLPLRETVRPDGRIAGHVDHIGGMRVVDARARMVEILAGSGLIERTETSEHQVPVHERCGLPVELITSQQWFVGLLDHRQTLIDAADGVRWHPPRMKRRYRDWVENLRYDWCVSRQRFFGVPVPAWYCRACGGEVLARAEDLPANPLSDPPPGPCRCGGTDLQPDRDVLDTWATSSLTPLINARWGQEGDMTERLLPMSLRAQAHEIIRTWAFYTIARTVLQRGQLPWTDIMISGFVVARPGEKISKSRHNAVEDPPSLIREESADVVRYWAASGRLGSDISFSGRELDTGRRLMVKLWNACRFALTHLEGYTWQPGTVRWPLDRWMLCRLAAVQESVSSHLEDCEVGLARRALERFFWRSFCDNYLEIVKDRLYSPDSRGKDAQLSARSTLYQLTLELLKMFAVFVPHVTEEIFMKGLNRREARSIHLTTWGGFERPGGEDFPGDELFQIIGLVRGSKSTRGLPLVTPVRRLAVIAPSAELVGLAGAEDDIAAASRARRVEFSEGPEISVDVVLEEPGTGETPQ